MWTIPEISTRFISSTFVGCFIPLAHSPPFYFAIGSPRIWTAAGSDHIALWDVNPPTEDAGPTARTNVNISPG